MAMHRTLSIDTMLIEEPTNATPLSEANSSSLSVPALPIDANSHLAPSPIEQLGLPRRDEKTSAHISKKRRDREPLAETELKKIKLTPKEKAIETETKEKAKVNVTWFENIDQFIAVCQSAESKSATPPIAKNILQQLKNEKIADGTDSNISALTPIGKHEHQFTLTMPFHRDVDVVIKNIDPKKGSKDIYITIYDNKTKSKLMSIKIDPKNNMYVTYNKFSVKIEKIADENSWPIEELQTTSMFFYKHLKTENPTHTWSTGRYKLSPEQDSASANSTSSQTDKKNRAARLKNAPPEEKSKQPIFEPRTTERARKPKSLSLPGEGIKLERKPCKPLGVVNIPVTEIKAQPADLSAPPLIKFNYVLAYVHYLTQTAQLTDPFTADPAALAMPLNTSDESAETELPRLAAVATPLATPATESLSAAPLVVDSEAAGSSLQMQIDEPDAAPASESLSATPLVVDSEAEAKSLHMQIDELDVAPASDLPSMTPIAIPQTTHPTASNTLEMPIEHDDIHAQESKMTSINTVSSPAVFVAPVGAPLVSLPEPVYVMDPKAGQSFDNPLKTKDLIRLVDECKGKQLKHRLKHVIYKHSTKSTVKAAEIGGYRDDVYSQFVEWEDKDKKTYVIKITFTLANEFRQKTSYHDRNPMSWHIPVDDNGKPVPLSPEHPPFYFQGGGKRFFEMCGYQHETEVFRTWGIYNPLDKLINTTGELTSVHKGEGDAKGDNPISGTEVLKLEEIYSDLIDLDYTYFVNAATLDWHKPKAEQKDFAPIPDLPSVYELPEHSRSVAMRLMEILNGDETLYEKALKNRGEVKLVEGEITTEFEGKAYQNEYERKIAIGELRQFTLNDWHIELKNQSDAIIPKLSEEAEALRIQIENTPQFKKIIQENEIKSEEILSNPLIYNEFLLIDSHENQRNWLANNPEKNLLKADVRLTVEKIKNNELSNLFFKYHKRAIRAKLPQALAALGAAHLGCKSINSEGNPFKGASDTIANLEEVIAKASKAAREVAKQTGNKNLNPSPSYIWLSYLLCDGVNVAKRSPKSAMQKSSMESKSAASPTMGANKKIEKQRDCVSHATGGSVIWRVDRTKKAGRPSSFGIFGIKAKPSTIKPIHAKGRKVGSKKIKTPRYMRMSLG